NVVTSDGSEFKTVIQRSFIRCMLMIENGSEMISEACILGGLGDFEDNIINLEEFYSEIATTYKHLINKKSAVFAEAGIQDVVLGADLAGILAHEAIGHTTEADLVRNGSIASRLMDQPIASEMVNLIDIPHTYDGKLCPRPVFVDDEGVEAKTVNVIENGILRNYMHNKESALHYGAEPMGNARASQFSDEPLIRMRNTMIVPGKDKVEDMIKSIKNGYYLLKPNNGQADSTSEFMFGVTRGYEIKDGKICKAIKETTISGIAVELLKTITAISDDLKWSGAGTCGKKQGIAVGMGGPAIKCKVTMGGK
ncbi:MAG: peptidase, partial [Candidatus Cloacimonetes bacterium 4572_65]